MSFPIDPLAAVSHLAAQVLRGVSPADPMARDMLEWLAHVQEGALARWRDVHRSGIGCVVPTRRGPCGHSAISGCAICRSPTCLEHAMVAHNADVVCVKCVNEFVVIARARQGGQEPGPAAQPEDTQALRKKHLKTLGLTPDSSWTEVQSTYRDLVKKNHPDKHPDGQKREDATAKMSKINEAYSWLLARREAA